MATREPASIRYKNPGAMWGSPLAAKWGSTRKVQLKDGTGQNNNIAVFDTHVEGICAQLDLWRASKHYRNKKFSDAIAIWSGRNHVKEYIAFVLKRVPGMTPNTVMNDDFWQSGMGVGFLKAQAWHEAGKPYPAAESDWLEAQRIVFDRQPAARAKPLMAVREPEEATPPGARMEPEAEISPRADSQVLYVQKRLRELGYFEIGEPDGGENGMSRTEGGILTFRNDNGLPLSKEIDDELLAALAKAAPRRISEARATATVGDLRAKGSTTIGLLDRIKGWAGGLLGVAGVGAVGSSGEVIDQATDGATRLSGAKDAINSLGIGWGAIIILAIACLAVWYFTDKAAKTRLADYQKGKNT